MTETLGGENGMLITGMDEFCTAYADAVIADMTDEQQTVASGQRNLSWKGDRMPLAEAAELYAKICNGYNEFEPGMLRALDVQFGGSGIEVTPARESSVAVYLHIPDNGVPGLRGSVRQWIEKNWNADEIDWWDTDNMKGSLRVWWD